jgi:hypothetical protein
MLCSIMAWTTAIPYHLLQVINTTTFAHMRPTATSPARIMVRASAFDLAFPRIYNSNAASFVPTSPGIDYPQFNFHLGHPNMLSRLHIETSPLAPPSSPPSSSSSPALSSYSFPSPYSTPPCPAPASSSPGCSDSHIFTDIKPNSSFWSSSPPSSSTSSLDLEKQREPSPDPSDHDNGASRRRFACLLPGCTRRFTSQYTLKVHMDAHKPKPRSSFPCTLGCAETFSRQHDRLRHEVAKHGKVCDWLCSDCGRFFSSKKTLGNHKCPSAPGGTRWVTETVSYHNRSDGSLTNFTRYSADAPRNLAAVVPMLVMNCVVPPVL